MKKIIAFFKKTDYRHYICFALLIGFVCLSVFRFTDNFWRLLETFRDFGRSFVFYWTELLDLKTVFVPSVNEFTAVNFELPFSLPPTWEEFTVSFKNYWKAFADSENFFLYLATFGAGSTMVGKIIVMVLPVILIFSLFIVAFFKKQNNRYNVDTKPLKLFKKISDKTYRPIKAWLVGFIQFLGYHRKWLYLWALVWLYNFNAFAIVVEVFAYYFYFIVTFEFASLYRQVLKFLYDLFPMLSFVPAPVWSVVAVWIFDRIRKRRAYDKLEHFEAMNEGFLLERGIVLFFVGRMGKGKTEMLTSSALSMERAMRSKALSIIQKCDLRFPYFPWINFELEIQKRIEKKKITSLASLREWVRSIEKKFDKAAKKEDWQQCRELLFDYDLERYELFFNDDLKIHSIFDTLETYGMAYLVYITSTSLIESNYSIRSDNVKDSVGNFPRWDCDFFHRRAEDQDFISKYAHIIDFDSMRLGKKFITDNKAAMEFGVKCVTEIGKERLNAMETKELKKEDAQANQLNDGFNDYLKMSRHPALIEFVAFMKILADDQRPESWGADARDLTEIVHIDDKSEEFLAMPFFIEGPICDWLLGKFEKLHLDVRYTRGDNCLIYYLLHTFYSKISAYYTRIYNRFGYRIMSLSTEDGTQDGELREHDYFLMNIQVHSDRYSSDCFSDVLAERILRDKMVYDERPTYMTSKASFGEMQKQNSYFVNRLNASIVKKSSRKKQKTKKKKGVDLSIWDNL